MTEHLPSWPTTPPTYGSVVLREFTDDDVHLAFELGDDPYVPLMGSLPALPAEQQALEWIQQQRVGGTDCVHLDHPNSAPDRAVHRTVEQQLKSRCRGLWFQREGLLRNHQEIGDARRDMLLYAATGP